MQTEERDTEEEKEKRKKKKERKKNIHTEEKRKEKKNTRSVKIIPAKTTGVPCQTWRSLAQKLTFERITCFC